MHGRARSNWTLFAAGCLTGLLGNFNLGAAQSAHRVTLAEAGDTRGGCQFRQGRFLPVWSGRALLVAEDADSAEPLICVMPRGGQREAVSFGVPGATRITLYGLAGGPDGSLALIGGMYGSDGRAAAFATFLAWMSPDRKRRTIVRLLPYIPTAVTIAADGVLWVAGWQQGEDGHPDPDYNILRRFNSSGRLLSSFLRKTAVDQGELHEPSAESRLLSSRDRVGWYQTRGGQYIEFALDGTELARYATAPLTGQERIQAVSLSEGDDVFVSRVGSHAKWDLLSLDRERRTWVPVALPGEAPPRWRLVLGFDGTELATTSDWLLTIRHYKLANLTVN